MISFNETGDEIIDKKILYDFEIDDETLNIFDHLMEDISENSIQKQPLSNKEIEEKFENLFENDEFNHQEILDHDLDSINRLNKENKGLNEEQKKEIKNETSWCDEIINSIGSIEEYQVYKNAGLEDQSINEKHCLVKLDIDINQKDSFGRTNKERMKQGLAPLSKNIEPIELHHIGQKNDSPLAELTQEEHRGKGNDCLLHEKNKDSEIDRSKFANERNQHWKERAREVEKNE